MLNLRFTSFGFVAKKAKKEQICAVLFCFVMKKKNSGAILQIYWLS